MTKRRIIKWLAGVGGLCIILVLGLALLLPRLVDSQAVRERIRGFLLSRTNGNVAIKNIDLRWFPRPAVVLRDTSLSFSDRVTGTIQSIEVYPSILGLLVGRLEVSRAKVVGPALALHLPEPAAEPFNLDEIESQIHSLITLLAAKIPGMVITVTGGSLEFRIGERPSVMITELDGSLVAPPGELALQFSSRANVFDSLSIQETIAGDTLVTKGRIKIDRLRLRESLAALFPRPDEYVESGDLSLDVMLTAVGLKQIKIEVAGSLPSLGLVRQNRKTVIEGIAFKGMISRDEGIVNAVIEQLNLVSPRLTATGKLTVDPASPAVGLTLVGRDLDVSQVRDAALNIAGDIKVVADTFHDVKGGQLSEVSFQASAQSFAALSKNIAVTGRLRDGNIFASVLGIDLDEVDAQFTVSRGILEAKQFSARYGKILGREGTLRLGLEGKSVPFHLDLSVDSDAAELRSLLLRVVKNDGFRKELSRIRNLEGNLVGRLVLGERSDSLLPEVSVSKANVRGSYDPIPYPISIKEGRFHYNADKISLEGVGGAVGLSSFSRLTGSLDYNDPRY
jgi:hypothetical protein